MKKIQRQEQRTIIGRFIVQNTECRLHLKNLFKTNVLHTENNSARICVTFGYAARSPFHCPAVDVVNDCRFRIWIVQDLHIQEIEDNKIETDRPTHKDTLKMASLA